ncbi:MAG: hypothetical protein JNL94_02325, partial [Planctomycetes bacterium]|nr:hypothetical protein [Planctomycetota bacterium]
MIECAIERQDVREREYLWRVRAFVDDGAQLALDSAQRVIAHHVDSRRIHEHRLRLADFYAELARSYVVAVDPTQATFDAARAQPRAGGWSHLCRGRCDRRHPGTRRGACGTRRTRSAARPHRERDAVIARRCVAIFVLGAVAGCGSLTLDPAVREARGDLLDAARRAVEASLTDRFDPAIAAEVAAADATYVIDTRKPAGVAQRVRVLEALARSGRDDRLDALDALRADAADPVFVTYVEHLLEQDDRWYALALERDSVWNVVAGFFNGILASGYALLNANPIGVVKPIVHGVDGLIRDVPLDARDRKLAALKKRMAKQGVASEDVVEAIAELEDATVKEELWLAERALERDRVDVAAMHWSVAHAVRPTAAEVDAMAQAIARRVEERAAALDLALRVEPRERELGLDQRDAPAHEAAEVASARLTSDDRRLLEAPRPDVMQRVATARQRHDDERSRYVWTGRRDSHDPLRRYAEARAALHRSLLDRLEPIVWVPATLFRAVLNAFTDPVADQPLVDALAKNANGLPQDDPRRAELLRELARRLDDRGQSEQ